MKGVVVEIVVLEGQEEGFKLTSFQEMRDHARGASSEVSPMLARTVFERRPNTFTMLLQKLFDPFLVPTTTPILILRLHGPMCNDRIRMRVSRITCPRPEATSSLRQAQRLYQSIQQARKLLWASTACLLIPKRPLHLFKLQSPILMPQ